MTHVKEIYALICIWKLKVLEQMLWLTDANKLAACAHDSQAQDLNCCHSCLTTIWLYSFIMFFFFNHCNSVNSHRGIQESSNPMESPVKLVLVSWRMFPLLFWSPVLSSSCSSCSSPRLFFIVSWPVFELTTSLTLTPSKKFLSLFCLTSCQLLNDFHSFSGCLD